MNLLDDISEHVGEIMGTDSWVDVAENPIRTKAQAVAAVTRPLKEHLRVLESEALVATLSDDLGDARRLTAHGRLAVVRYLLEELQS